MSDNSNNLPTGWIEAPISDLLAPLEDGRILHHGWSPQCEKRPSLSEDEWGVLKTTAVQDGEFLSCHNKCLPTKLTPRPHLEVKEGDLLLTCAGPRNRCGVPCLVKQTRRRLILSGKMYRFRVPDGLMNSSYLEAFLRSKDAQAAIDRMKTGISDSGLNLTHGRFLPLPVRVAPLQEQKRIVAKIEELFSALDAGVAALERAKANLKRYRAAVLKAAVEGRLTEQWRADNPDVEPASKLLERILQKRRKKWEDEQLRKYKKKGKEPPKNWKDKYREPDPVDATTLPALPETWCWASVEQIGHVQLGRQRSPKNHNGPHMRPYLRVANVFEDRIDISDVMEMNFTPNEFETYRLSYGDILLNEGQSMELVGRPAMYRDEVPGGCFTNTLVRFRPFDGVDGTFALKVFLAYLKNGRFQKIATITVNIAHLGAGRFSEIEFPLPPVEEQAAIIAEVDHQFSLIDAAELVINKSLARAARLRQSILKRAFEGKLVPQDPNDESASKLLERIKAQKKVSEANGKPTKRKPRRKGRGRTSP